MTQEREEIKRIAKELIPDDSDQFFVNQKIDWTALRYRVEQSILTQVAKAKREAYEECAKIAVESESQYCASEDEEDVASRIAEAIRKRLCD